MKLLFAGTPGIAVPTLTALAQSRHEVAAVLTAPDRRVGRGRNLVPGPVKERATELGIPVLQPARLGAEARALVAAHEPELLVCVAYGRIFGPKFLALFEHGGINLHPSLLPAYRGPAPIPAAILAGDPVTGITVQALALQMDAGDILAQEEMALSGDETTGTLTERAALAGAELVARVVDQIADGASACHVQDHDAATYTGLISKQDGEVDFSRSAAEIERAVRAYQPWPLAFTFFNGQRLNILEASVVEGDAGGAQTAPGTVLRVDNERGILVETGSGQLALTRLQLQSRKALSWKEFSNGVNDFVGAVLGG